MRNPRSKVQLLRIAFCENNMSGQMGTSEIFTGYGVQIPLIMTRSVPSTMGTFPAPTFQYFSSFARKSLSV